jgi:hypothetical protein
MAATLSPQGTSVEHVAGFGEGKVDIDLGRI